MDTNMTFPVTIQEPEPAVTREKCSQMRMKCSQPFPMIIREWPNNWGNAGALHFATCVFN